MVGVPLDNSYSVFLSHGKNEAWVRALNLEAVASEPGPVKHFALYFVEKDDPSLGQGYVNPEGGYIVPLLPLRDFDAIYHLLQTEKQVYAHWNADNNNQLVWFWIGASRGPLPKSPTGVPLKR